MEATAGHQTGSRNASLTTPANALSSSENFQIYIIRQKLMTTN
jgi:hypothetical protein